MAEQNLSAALSSIVGDIEKCFELGWTDGGMVMPPYQALVDPMIEALGWSPTEVIGAMEELQLEVRAEHAAAAAVMAGCKREYARVLRPLTEALLDPEFNLQGVAVTTGGVSPTVYVSGPIVKEMGFYSGANVLGAARRLNATVGRYASLLMRFCGLGGGLLEEHGTLGHPGRLGFCVAEHETTRWGPFHTQLGLPAERSAVTVMATEGPNSVNNHYAVDGAQVLETIADCIAHFGATSFFYRLAGCTIVIADEHRDLICRDFTRDEAKAFLFEKARRSSDDLHRLGRVPRVVKEGFEVPRGQSWPPMKSPSDIHFLEAGGAAGKFSAVIPSWVVSRTVTRLVD